jgi:hypothetical protein
MSVSTDVKRTGFFYSTALTEVIHELEEVAREMLSDGFEKKQTLSRPPSATCPVQVSVSIERPMRSSRS